MNVDALYSILNQSNDAAVRFQLPSGEMIPDHFHVTEVGRIDKHFIDCGGTVRKASSCLIQTWTAEDRDHRLVAGKLAKIVKMATPLLGTLDLPVEVEYGSDVASQYRVVDVSVDLHQVTFQLVGKQTDCLAKDKCGEGACGSESGCC
jgi:hypothetical protein